MVIIGHLEHLGALHALVALLDSPAPPNSSRHPTPRVPGAGGVDVLWRVCMVAGMLSAVVTNDTACLVRPHTRPPPPSPSLAQLNISNQNCFAACAPRPATPCRSKC